MIVLSEKQAGAIIKAHSEGTSEATVSLDLDRTTERVVLQDDNAVFPDAQRLSIDTIRKIEGDSCFLVEGDKLFRMQIFSAETRRTYKLVPTDAAPTISISGIRMHQTKDMNPTEDAEAKVKALKPLKGRIVLDTCMGLGYSAIQAVKEGALHVTTVEADKSVVEMAKVNPWSAELWTSSRINVIEGNVFNVAAGFHDNCYDRIIHDPPRVRMAGELYGMEFYRHLHRILKPEGILFHYVGQPGSKFRNRKVAKGVIERLREAGFDGIKRIVDAQGVRAVKVR